MNRKKIGYAKIGRSLKFDPSSFGPQGDPEAPQLLARLARRNPDVDWYVVGRHDGYLDHMPKNVIDPWPPMQNRTDSHMYYEDIARFMGDELDGMVLHVGQHGTSHIPLTASKIPWAEYDKNPREHRTQPLTSVLLYGVHLIEGMNRMGDRTDGHAPVIYICVDPRNYIKARDIKWPTGTDQILSQYTFSKVQKHDRLRDPRPPTDFHFTNVVETLRNDELWLVEHHYAQAGLELMILPDDWDTWGSKSFEEREPLGVASTAGWVNNPEGRRSLMIQRWVFENIGEHVPVYGGKWDKKSLAEVTGEVLMNSVDEFPDLLGSWRTTLSLPPAARGLNGDQWSVAKPYQAFAAKTVCFIVGSTDQQGYVLPSRKATNGAHEVADGLWSIRDDWTEDDLHLAHWLRVLTPDEFKTRVNVASKDYDTWRWLIKAQRNLLRRRWDEATAEDTIERRLGLHG